MFISQRHPENPILSPSNEPWEKEAVFNGSVVREGEIYHLVYRAVSQPISYKGYSINQSTIGYARGFDGVHFSERRQIIYPEYEWEKYGCEDPRITEFEGKFYIFYTALSTFPFTPEGIKTGVAVTKNFENIEKHPVTTFNSKAMSLFPERVNGKIAVILTANTDRPPAKIAMAYFGNIHDIWNGNYWDEWYQSLDSHLLYLRRNANDHVEAGAPPIKTEYGWLIIYSYIYNYFSPQKLFGIEAVLTDLENPLKILGRTNHPIIVPEAHYELYGKVPNVVFPSGAIANEEELKIYYGASDTTCCLVTVPIDELLSDLIPDTKISFVTKKHDMVQLERYKGNPIITPIQDHHWENFAAFNPSAIYEGGKFHILYRAMSSDGTSVVGYANSKDGFQIEERLNQPIYIPRESFELRTDKGFCGCEDARLTKFGEKIYMCYTAFDGKTNPRVAITSIEQKDFISKLWKWEKPKLISPPGIDDKNTCILSEKVNGKFVFFHRFSPHIWIDLVDDLSFNDEKFLHGKVLMSPRVNRWDSEKIGIGGPPLKTEDGWLLIYHGLSRKDLKYRLGAALFSLDDPIHLIARLDYPILEPLYDYENEGQRGGTVFACGVVSLKDRIHVYYGGGDQVVCVATISQKKLLNEVKKYRIG